MRLIAEDIPVYHSEKRYLRQNGSVIIGSSTISIIRNNLDEAQFFIGMVEDITLRKEAETELEKSYSLIKATLESTEDGILVVDLDGKIDQFNNKFAAMWRIPPEILDSGNDNQLLEYVMDQLVDPESFIENVRSCIHSRKLPHQTFLNLKTEGSLNDIHSLRKLMAGV